MRNRHRTRQLQLPVHLVFRTGRVLKTKIFKVIILILILSLSVTPVTKDVYAALAFQASSLTFITDADARVQESNPNNNYGSANYLLVDGTNNPDVESFIRFTVNGVTGSVQNARLRVYITSNSSANGPAAYAANNSWTETGITWNNRPARTSGVLDNKGSTSRNSWVEYNVTAAVTGNGTYTFVLAADSSDAIRFSSREGSHAPELVVTFNSGAGTATSIQPPTATRSQTAASTNTQLPASTSTPTRPQLGS